MMWSEKYRPTSIDQMVGNEDERLTVIRWLAKWVRGTKPLLLVGPPGTGKTTLARLLANEFDYELIEMNASDTRNKDSLRERLLPVLSNTSSLFGKKIMLFLDEVDGISGREDSGGLDALVDIMKEPTVPVIMAANEKSAKIKDLAKACKTIEFSKIPSRELLMFLNHVLKREGHNISSQERIASVVSSDGDVRAALNNAQSRAAGYNTSSKDPSEFDIADALNSYFSAKSLEQAQRSFARADASFPDPRYETLNPDSRRRDMLSGLFSSIVSSLGNSKTDQAGSRIEAIARVLDVLSRADVMVGRAGATRQWHLLKYLRAFLPTSLYEFSRGFAIKYSQYSLPWPLMGPILAQGQTSRKLSAAIAPHLYMSRSKFSTFGLPYLLNALDKKIKKIDLDTFAINNFGDESFSESLSKALARARK